MQPSPPIFIFFFFNDTATTEIYTLSLHDALPIFERGPRRREDGALMSEQRPQLFGEMGRVDRKSTRLNSSHSQISYAVFCLKKKKLLSVDALTDFDPSPMKSERQLPSDETLIRHT